MSVDLDMLHDELKARLDADAYFADITVLKYNEKGIVAEIEKSLGGMTSKAGKRGLFVYLSGWFADVNSRDVPGPIFDTVGLNATVIEVPILNTVATTGTGKPAMQAAIKLCQLLHHYRPEGLAETIMVDRGAIRQVQAPNDNAIAFSVSVIVPPNFTTPSKCATPAMTADGATPRSVVITCATAGASIYYTTDESYPWSGNDEATLYTESIALTEAATIRAVAHKTGLISSDSALGIYT